MNKRTLIAGGIAVLMLATAALRAAEPMTTYISRPGSKMRIEGTANVIHPTWFMESPTFVGMMQVGPGFPTEPGQTVTPGKVEATARMFIPVRSLKSVEPDGRPYSEHMDDIAYEHLKESQSQQIVYRLTELTLKEAPTAKDAPYVFEAKGDLAIAGVTNATTMTVNILPVLNGNEKKLEITGNTALKMTDYKVPVVDISIVGLAHIKTGDEVKLSFKWVLAQRKAATAAAK